MDGVANHPDIRPILPDNSPSINSFKSGFMALLQILRYPDPRLHKKAAPVTQVDARIRQLAAELGLERRDQPRPAPVPRRTGLLLGLGRSTRLRRLPAVKGP